MDSKQQLELFLAAIEEAASNESLSIIKQADEFRESELNAARIKAAESGRSFVRSEGDKQKIRAYSKVFEAGARFRKNIYEEEKRVLSQISNAVKMKIEEFVDSDSYACFIENRIKAISAFLGEQEFVLYCNGFTQKRCNILSENNRQIKEIIIDDTIIMGGVRAFSESQSIEIDDTLDSRFEKNIKDFFVD